MKNFWKMVLAVIVGSILLSIITLMLCSGFFSALGSSKAPIPKSGVLMIDMSKIIIDEQTQEGNPFASIQSGGGQAPVIVGIRDAVCALKTAAADPGVKYIYLKTDGNATGAANIEEFRKALKDFRASGKAVVAYTEAPATAGYWLASVADKIYMTSHHGVSPMLTGISTRMIFLKDLLDKLGVKVQLIRHGRYKSAGEMYVRSEASADNLAQYKALVGALWGTVSKDIAESRGISVEALDKAVDGLELCSPEDFVAAGLVDSVMDREALRQRLADLAVVGKWSDVKMIPFDGYAAAKVLPNHKSTKKIAIIYASGEIVEASDPNNISGNRFASIISKVRADSTVKAVVLRVNSPGGSVLASEKIKAELDLLQQHKPLVASYGAYAASGGYWISNACDKIYSDATTLTGSIGVFSMIPEFSGTLKNIAHVNVQSVSSNKHGDMYGFTRPLDAAETEFMHRSVELIYNDFISNVASGRDLDPSYVDEIGQGRVWAGSDALGIRLVDEIGTLEDAVAWAAAAAGDADVNAWNVVGYPKPLTMFEMITTGFGGPDPEEENIFAGTPLSGTASAILGWSRRIRSAKTDLHFARLPYDLVIE